MKCHECRKDQSRIAWEKQRFAVQDKRMSPMLALIVRIAERLDGGSG
jgi:hypothetical protein